MDREKLVKVAKEMNEVMGLDPAIDLDLEEGELYELVLESVGMVEPDDEFTDEVWEIINDIEAGAGKPAAEPEPKKEEKVDLAKLVNGTKKLKDLKALVESHDEFAPLRDSLDSYSGLHGPRRLKGDMLGCLGMGKERLEGNRPAKAAGGGKKKGGRGGEKTPLGHTVGSQAGNIDLVLLDTGVCLSIEQIAEKLSISKHRVKSHIVHLRKRQERGEFTLIEEPKGSFRAEIIRH